MFQNFQKPFRKDRIHNNYGGIIIYAKENIACKRRQDLENNQYESKWVELTLEAKSILLGLFYRPPNSPASAIGDIETSIDLAFDSNIKKHSNLFFIFENITSFSYMFERIFSIMCVFSHTSNHTLSFSYMFELYLGKLSNTVRLQAATQYSNL